MLSYLLSSLLVIAAPPPVSSQGSDSTLARAVILCDTRHLDPRNLDQSAKLLDQVIGAEPNQVRALSERSRVCYFLARGVGSKKEKLKLYQQGMALGKKAISYDSHSASAHFWYLVNLGASAKTKGNWCALNSVGEIKKELGEVLKDDPGSPAALDVEADLFYELPRLCGGDLNKSLGDLTRAVQTDSSFTRLYVDLAKVYIKKKDYGRARGYLTKVLEFRSPTYPADYILDDRPTAAKLLHEIEGKGL
jgi:tetratricopeptide (TPR) repeat protein